MKTVLFDYDLPRELVAQQPAAKRDRSRLLVLHRKTGATEHCTFSDLPQYLGHGDVLVVNDTRVLRARLYGKRKTGGTVEVLLIRRARRHTAGTSEEGNVWEAMLNCRGRLEDGEEIVFCDELSAKLLGRDEAGTSLVELFCAGELGAVLERIGRVPLPPYLKRPRGYDAHAEQDVERYQTVYAKKPGAVAAPTAGLHFTPELLSQIESRGCAVASITLHVGPGTFKPVRAENIEEHVIDSEYYSVTPQAAAAINRAGRTVAVGTTTCRALETLATNGETRITSGEGWADLFIRPPYRFRVVDSLVTNFHLPKSSLLMLVSAFATRELILAAYEEAKRKRYRFYSYGDAMLIL